MEKYHIIQWNCGLLIKILGRCSYFRVSFTIKMIK